MELTEWPTFGQLLQYLRDRNFSVGPGQPGYVVAEYPDDDCWFVFRDRELDTPARETELVNLRIQLTYRGFVSEAEFARFWDPRRQACPSVRP